MTPEEATQMMLRDLVTSGEIAEAVRVAEEIEFRVTKLAKESQARQAPGRRCLQRP